MPARLTDLVRIPHFVPLAAATLMMGVALSLTAPYLSLFGIEEASMSPVRLGVFMTLVSASGVFASTAVGRWSDRNGRHRTPLIASLAAAALGYASLSIVRGYAELMIVGVVLLGPGAASLSQVFALGRSTLHAEDTAQAEFAQAAMRTLLSAAWVFGPAVGALILAQGGFKGLFAFAAASFAASGFIALRMSEARGHAERHDGEDCEALRRGAPCAASAIECVPIAVGDSASNVVLAARRRQAIPRILLALTLIGLAANATMILLPLYLVHALHGTRLTVSAVLGTGALLEIPMMLWLGATSSRLSKPKWLTAAAAVHAAYFIALAAIRQPLAVVPLQALSAMVVAITSCLGMTYVQDLMPGETGAATALFFNASRVGSILAGVLSGTLIGAFGYRAAFLLCAALVACAFALLSFDAVRVHAKGLGAKTRRA
ncbi:sugar efflux transporter [Trinickia acidisoli]|uniref:sugar efflux transporter n=1 Tax=Trinickia acidisoli TaxID=2767482 RepID=UPI002852F366|nr:sugar efflux transporter [Trinickia acidisoli]